MYTSSKYIFKTCRLVQYISELLSLLLSEAEAECNHCSASRLKAQEIVRAYLVLLKVIT